MDNKYTGEIDFTVGGVAGILVYDWAALGVVRSTITQEEWNNLAQLHPEKLAAVAAAGFKKKSPHITAAFIIENSPPIMEMANAVDRALLFAYHGPETARKILEPVDQLNKELEKATEKKTAAPQTKS